MDNTSADNLTKSKSDLNNNQIRTVASQIDSKLDSSSQIDDATRLVSNSALDSVISKDSTTELEIKNKLEASNNGYPDSQLTYDQQISDYRGRVDNELQRVDNPKIDKNQSETGQEKKIPTIIGSIINDQSIAKQQRERTKDDETFREIKERQLLRKKLNRNLLKTAQHCPLRKRSGKYTCRRLRRPVDRASTTKTSINKANDILQNFSCKDSRQKQSSTESDDELTSNDLNYFQSYKKTNKNPLEHKPIKLKNEKLRNIKKNDDKFNESFKRAVIKKGSFQKLLF